MKSGTLLLGKATPCSPPANFAREMVCELRVLRAVTISSTPPSHIVQSSSASTTQPDVCLEQSVSAPMMSSESCLVWHEGMPSTSGVSHTAWMRFGRGIAAVPLPPVLLSTSTIIRPTPSDRKMFWSAKDWTTDGR